MILEGKGCKRDIDQWTGLPHWDNHQWLRAPTNLISPIIFFLIIEIHRRSLNTKKTTIFPPTCIPRRITQHIAAPTLNKRWRTIPFQHKRQIIIRVTVAPKLRPCPRKIVCRCIISRTTHSGYLQIYYKSYPISSCTCLPLICNLISKIVIISLKESNHRTIRGECQIDGDDDKCQ